MDDDWIPRPVRYTTDPVSLMADQLVDVVAINEELLKALKELVGTIDDAHFDIKKVIPNIAEVLLVTDARKRASNAIARAEAR